MSSLTSCHSTRLSELGCDPQNCLGCTQTGLLEKPGQLGVVVGPPPTLGILVGPNIFRAGLSQRGQLFIPHTGKQANDQTRVLNILLIF